MIALQRADVAYGTLQALSDVSVEIQAGEVVALVGRNGAGKTTLLKTLAGWLRCSSGALLVDGKPFESPTPEALSQRGVALVPEDRQVFPWLTVEENLRIAKVAHAPRRWTESDAFALFPRLQERRKASAAALSGGEQQMLAIARGLLCQPTYLLLDEPTEGLAPVVIASLVDAIRAIADSGIAIMLVEQNAYVPGQLAQRFYVLDAGKVAWSGTKLEFEESKESVHQILSV